MTNDERRHANALVGFVVIPARMASTRLARKMLLSETGKPLIQHTYETARSAKRPLGVCVATDDDRIRDAVRTFGGLVEMTSPDCASGTDRVAEVARRLDGVDIIVNLQGDEPELPGEAIDRAIEVLERHPDVPMSTLAAPLRRKDLIFDPACVKVVFDARGRAVYFSRSPIPYPREWDDALLAAEPASFFQHIGVYAYRREFLLKLAGLPQPAIEQIEKLEQLRVLSAGFDIAVAVIDEAAPGIDTPADYAAFVERQRARGTTASWGFAESWPDSRSTSAATAPWSAGSS